MYEWNPVFNLVMQIKKDYIKCSKKISYNLEEMINFLNKKEYNEIFSGIDITQFHEYILLKYKSFVELGNFEFYYQEDFWEKNNNFFQECRSLVINLKEEEIVLSPQKKFFNIGERKEWELSKIKDRIAKSSLMEISSKLDGSNQNARWYKNSIFISGSSALDKKSSWRLAETQKFLTKEYEQMMKAYPDYTFMFEYISPKNQIVVYYPLEKEGLYLFGMRNVYTGKEKTYHEVLSIGKFFGVKTTDIFNKTLDDILSEVDKWKGNEKEGWVISIFDEQGNNFKAKLKVNDYVTIHRFIAKIVSPNAVIQSIIDEKFDDLISKIPEGSKEQVMSYAKEVYEYTFFVKATVNKYKELAKKKETKKEAMIWIDLNVPKDFLGYVKNAYLGKEWDCLKKNSNGHKKLGEIQEIMKKYKGDYKKRR